MSDRNLLIKLAAQSYVNLQRKKEATAKQQLAITRLVKQAVDEEEKEKPKSNLLRNLGIGAAGLGAAGLGAVGGYALARPEDAQAKLKQVVAWLTERLTPKPPIAAKRPPSASAWPNRAQRLEQDGAAIGDLNPEVQRAVRQNDKRLATRRADEEKWIKFVLDLQASEAARNAAGGSVPTVEAYRDPGPPTWPGRAPSVEGDPSPSRRPSGYPKDYPSNMMPSNMTHESFGNYK